MVKKWSSERSKNKLGYLFAMVISSELLHSNHSLHQRANNHREQAPHFKGIPEGSSDQEFRSSILCDVSEISWWLISRSIENLLKMTSPNFRVGSARLRLSPRWNSKVKWIPLWTILNRLVIPYWKILENSSENRVVTQGYSFSKCFVEISLKKFSWEPI